MARSRTAPSPRAIPGLDKTGPATAQDGGRLPGQADASAARAALEETTLGEDWAAGAVHRGRLRVRTLVTLRWLVLAGEALLLLAVMAMGFNVQYALCFAAM